MDLELTVDYRDERISLTNIFFDHHRAFAQVEWNKAKSVVTCADHIGKRPPFEAATVYMAMMSFAQNGLCRAAHETIGQKIGAGRIFVLRQCKVLELLGWAIKIKQGGDGDKDVCHYQLTQPAWSRKPEKRPGTPPLAATVYPRNTHQGIQGKHTSVSQKNTKVPLGVCTESIGGGEAKPQPTPPPSASPQTWNPDPQFSLLYEKQHGKEIVWTKGNKSLYREAEENFGAHLIQSWKNYLANSYWHSRNHPLKGFISQANDWMPKKPVQKSPPKAPPPPEPEPAFDPALEAETQARKKELLDRIARNHSAPRAQ